jgi:hypothetical protein
VQFAYQWQRCAPGPQACADIPKAQSSAYVAVATDIGFVLRVLVTAQSMAGSGSAVSAPSDVVVAKPRTLQRSRCRVPRVVGMKLVTARRTLSKARCRLGAVRRRRSVKRAGVIVAQRPKPGTQLRVGGKVTVVVSLGRRR